MTILQRLASPKPYMRLTRGEYERLLDRLYEDRDRAEGALRADRDRIAAILERRAAAYELDAAHLDRLGDTKSPLTAGQRRAIADELRDVIRDVEGSS